MFLNLAKLTPALAEPVLVSPNLIHALFFDSEKKVEGYNAGPDSFGDDYRMYSEVYEAMIEHGGVEDLPYGLTHLLRDTETPCGAPVVIAAYDFCYGPGFLYPAAAVPKIADALKEQCGHCEGFFDELIAFFEKAAADGCVVIGGVS
jgi:hypothetical protein